MRHNPLLTYIFCVTAVILPLHSHEQSCASAVSAGLPAAGLLWPGCGLWSAGSFSWHAHSLLYGSRGEILELQLYRNGGSLCKKVNLCAPQMIMVLWFQFFSSLLVLTASWFIFLIYYVRSIITFLGNNKDSRCTAFSHHAGNAKSCSMKFLYCMK